MLSPPEHPGDPPRRFRALPLAAEALVLATAHAGSVDLLLVHEHLGGRENGDGRKASLPAVGITRVGYPESRKWEASCGGCLKSSGIVDGTREDAEAAVRALFWELRENGTTWCVDCQRSAREVKVFDRRGRRRR